MAVFRSVFSWLLPRPDEVSKQAKDLAGLDERQLELGSLHRSSDMVLSEAFSSLRADTAWRRYSPLVDQFDIIDGTGGVNPGDRRAVFYLVHHMRAARVLEIGTHIGASTIHLAGALASLREEGLPDARLVSVDKLDVNCESTKPWLDYGNSCSPRAMIERLGFDRFTSFHRSSAVEFLSACTEQFDFIFLDGDHAAAAVYNEVAIASRLLKPGGVILLHDYFPSLEPLWGNGSLIAGPFLAVERLKSENAELVSLPLGDLPWPTKLGSNTTSLALLLRRG